jgi:Spondin_N
LILVIAEPAIRPVNRNGADPALDGASFRFKNSRQDHWQTEHDMRFPVRLPIILVAASLAAGANPALAVSMEVYNVSFNAVWSAISHPQDFPDRAHFTGPIGATHDSSYALFEEGRAATEGLRRVAESGKDSPLDQEIGQAIKNGAAGSLIVGSSLYQLPGQTSVEFTIDERHPLVSLVTMIAPSPDWFTGVASVNLFDGGQWVAEKSVTVYAWDAGTDSGATYRAPDVVTQPRGRVTLSDAPYFRKDGQPLPVGTITFKKKM